MAAEASRPPLPVTMGGCPLDADNAKTLPRPRRRARQYRADVRATRPDPADARDNHWAGLDAPGERDRPHCAPPALLRPAKAGAHLSRARNDGRSMAPAFAGERRAPAALRWGTRKISLNLLDRRRASPASVVRRTSRTLVAVVEAAGAVHGLAIVPHDEVSAAGAAIGGRVDEFALRRVLGEVSRRNMRASGISPAFDRAGMRGEEQRFAPGLPGGCAPGAGAPGRKRRSPRR